MYVPSYLIWAGYGSGGGYAGSGDSDQGFSWPVDIAPALAYQHAVTQQVYTLLVEVGRKSGDGLPDGAAGATILAYAAGVDEAEAVRETVAVLKGAGLAPLDITGYGTAEERQDVEPEEWALMERALAERSVVVAEVTPKEA